MELKTYRGRIEIKTPVHITGNEISKFEYYMDGSYAVLYDIDSIPYESLYRMYRYLEKKLSEEKVKIQELKFNPKPFVVAAKKIRKIRFSDGDNKDIKLVTFQNGKPYIPGSTIKGWIRKSYTINMLKKIHKNRDDFNSNDVKFKNRIEMLFTKKLPGNQPPHQDIFRLVSISDAFPTGKWETEILEIEKWGISKGKVRKFTIYAEFITKGEFEFRLAIPSEWKIDEIEKWSIDFFNMIRKHESFTNDNVRSLSFPMPDNTPMILGRFCGILTKTILVLGLEYDEYKYLFDMAIGMAKNKKIKDTLRYMKKNGRRRNPLYVKHNGENKFPGIVNVSFEEME